MLITPPIIPQRFTLTRPAIANERLKRNRAGQVVLQLKSAFRDGTTHVVMSPLDFMQRLAALVPRPRLHLIRFTACRRPMPNCVPRSFRVRRRTPASTQPGARAVGVGKMLGWALAAAGEAGLKRMLELMDLEIRTARGLMGVTSLAQLNPSWVRPAVPVCPATQTNAYPWFEEQFK